MKLSVGLWDSMFGKKVTIDVPNGQGGIVKRTATEKFLNKMITQGKMARVIGVHIMNTITGYEFRNWTIGEDISEDLVNRFSDPETGELYVIVAYVDGDPKTMVLQKSVYEEKCREMDEAIENAFSFK